MKSLIAKIVLGTLSVVAGMPAAQADTSSPTTNGPTPMQVEAGWWLQQQSQRQRPSAFPVIVPATTTRAGTARPVAPVPTLPRPTPLSPNEERAVVSIGRTAQRNGIRRVAPVSRVCPVRRARR